MDSLAVIRFKGRVGRVGFYVSFAVVVLLFVGPILWMLSLSIRPLEEVFAFPPALIPPTPTLDAYAFVLASSRVPLYLFNSFKVAFLMVTGILLLCLPGAYAFSRFRFRFRRGLLLSILGFQMIAPVVIVVPLYSLLDDWGMLNTHFGLIVTLIGAQIPFSIWLLKGFLDGIPRSLDDSARIDGLSNLGALMRIILPNAAPGMAAVVIFNVIFGWSEFILPVILLSSEKLFPFSVGIYMFQSSYGTSWHRVAAASTLGIAPVLVFYIILQRFFVAGLVAGAVKE